eukprot:4318841-Ditylum_brightwellii.AAC.1
MQPVTFTLVVNDFGIKFVGDEHINHLIEVLKQNYTIEIDWTGSWYCGISLDWDCNKRILEINMREYIAEQIIKYVHPTLAKPQHLPFKALPPTFGKIHRNLLNITHHQPYPKGKTTHPTDCWFPPILWACHRQHHPQSTKHHLLTTEQRH